MNRKKYKRKYVKVCPLCGQKNENGMRVPIYSKEEHDFLNSLSPTNSLFNEMKKINNSIKELIENATQTNPPLW